MYIVENGRLAVFHNQFIFFSKDLIIPSTDPASVCLDDKEKDG